MVCCILIVTKIHCLPNKNIQLLKKTPNVKILKFSFIQILVLATKAAKPNTLKILSTFWVPLRIQNLEEKRVPETVFCSVTFSPGRAALMLMWVEILARSTMKFPPMMWVPKTSGSLRNESLNLHFPCGTHTGCLLHTVI